MDAYFIRLALGGLIAGLLFLPLGQTAGYLLLKAFPHKSRRTAVKLAGIVLGTMIASIAAISPVFAAVHLLALQPMGGRAGIFMLIWATGVVAFSFFGKDRFNAWLRSSDD